MNLSRDIDCFLLDLDGTIYIGDMLLNGALDAVKRMQRTARTVFLTNNSSRTRDFYVQKLGKMGFDVKRADVYTSANATIDFLKADSRLSKLYIVGSKEVADEFASAGLNICDEADTVVLTFDKTLTYEKLVKATRLIKNGARYIATHPDMTCPDPCGDLPDIGSFIRLIEGATGRLPNIICGKPNGIMANCVSRMTGVPLSRTAMVGDRLYTDMKFAIDNGLKSVLTLTGETDMALYKKSGLTVDKIIDSIAVWDV